MDTDPDNMIQAPAWSCYRVDCECGWMNILEDVDSGDTIKCEGCDEEVYITNRI